MVAVGALTISVVVARLLSSCRSWATKVMIRIPRGEAIPRRLALVPARHAVAPSLLRGVEGLVGLVDQLVGARGAEGDR